MPSPSANEQIRTAIGSDLDALCALENGVFDYDRMSRRQYRRHLYSRTAVVFVAVADTTLLGSAVVFYRSASRIGRLYSLAVRDEARGGGLGRRLLRTVETTSQQRGCDRLRLEVRTDNRAAAQLYESAGYRRIALVTAYYDNGADAWRYEKSLCNG